MWGEERDRVARISEAVLRAGVQERMIRAICSQRLASCTIRERASTIPSFGFPLSSIRPSLASFENT